MPDLSTDAQAIARRAAEKAARDSYGRLLAWLANQWRDVQAAEDALSDAFVAALKHWPVDGVPALPDAWLLTAARRRLLEAHRHGRVVAQYGEWLEEEQGSAQIEYAGIPDRRLQLMLTCSHPAIDPAVRTALMLQVVLGIDSKAIAAAFLVSPAAMAQRLVRAKNKLRDAGIPFDLTDATAMPERVHTVLEALYTGYGMVHDAGPGADSDAAMHELRGEMLHLAELVVALQPNNAEALGLFSLMLFCEARRDVSASSESVFVPLHERDPRRWNRRLLADAEGMLWRAAALRDPGPFQWEAAIQSAHSQPAFGGLVPWQAIVDLYRQLLALAPSIGARIGHAVAVLHVHSAQQALALLNGIELERVRTYQPYWVALSHALTVSGELVAGLAALDTAIGLSEQLRLRRYLLSRRLAIEALRADDELVRSGSS